MNKGQKKMEHILFSSHGVNSHFVVFWDITSKEFLSYTVSVTVRRQHALGCALIYCHPEGGRAWAEGGAEDRDGQHVAWSWSRCAQSKQDLLLWNLRTLTQFSFILSGLGSWLGSSSFVLIRYNKHLYNYIQFIHTHYNFCCSDSLESLG